MATSSGNGALLAIGVILIILVVLSAWALSSQIGAIKSTGSTVSTAGLAANVTALQNAVSSLSAKVTATKAGVSNVTRTVSAADINLAGFTLPASQSRVLFDVAGLGGGVDVEINGRIDASGVRSGDVVIQYINATQEFSQGTPAWVTVPVAIGNVTGNFANGQVTGGTFPVAAQGDIHQDFHGISAIRIVNLNTTSTAAMASSDMLSITVSCLQNVCTQGVYNGYAG
ncbi:MAG: hypothetical protein KGH98_02595 [Candidatus Micrarchaeota archaeon]|nr:hypothetical protein [Candidatus Micrarchaeota archaeon]